MEKTDPVKVKGQWESQNLAFFCAICTQVALVCCELLQDVLETKVYRLYSLTLSQSPVHKFPSQQHTSEQS